MPRALLVLVAVLAATLSACGKDAASDSSSSAGTALTITVVASEGADSQTYELRCDPAGGDHPQPAEACAALDTAGAKVFEPVAKDQMCTELYGGPQTATVTGTYDGDKVDATFRRTNGCEIDRWEQLGTTFFNVPLQ
ncbi:SSI family serine proteinase inhibitor [Aeromicrobium ginsengisoli]|uniref:SSI family serine proteinase inhibitor n=1 Tax=Aeromicrobium ginsengisoli TaxID=363867 RepID=UPI001CB6C0BC|nr:SSI family serine proteinase inhibitor [Aeromicrobium ginsengisoli]